MTSEHRLYPEVVDAIIKNEPFIFYRRMYHILTEDHCESNYWLWVDYILDKYNSYNHSGFSAFESKLNSLMDGLEGLLDEH